MFAVRLLGNTIQIKERQTQQHIIQARTSIWFRFKTQKLYTKK